MSEKRDKMVKIVKREWSKRYPTVEFPFRIYEAPGGSLGLAPLPVSATTDEVKKHRFVSGLIVGAELQFEPPTHSEIEITLRAVLQEKFPGKDFRIKLRENEDGKVERFWMICDRSNISYGDLERARGMVDGVLSILQRNTPPTEKPYRDLAVDGAPSDTVDALNRMGTPWKHGWSAPDKTSVQWTEPKMQNAWSHPSVFGEDLRTVSLGNLTPEVKPATSTVYDLRKAEQELQELQRQSNIQTLRAKLDDAHRILREIDTKDQEHRSVAAAQLRMNLTDATNALYELRKTTPRETSMDSILTELKQLRSDFHNFHVHTWNASWDMQKSSLFNTERQAISAKIQDIIHKIESIT